MAAIDRERNRWFNISQMKKGTSDGMQLRPPILTNRELTGRDL